jgi:hypothetical protein
VNHKGCPIFGLTVSKKLTGLSLIMEVMVILISRGG